MDDDRLSNQLDRAVILDEDAVDGGGQQTGKRRYGGLLLGIGALVILAAAIALGSWRSYAQYREALAIAQQHRDFVPRLRVASIKASDDVFQVTLPATTSMSLIQSRKQHHPQFRRNTIASRLRRGLA